ncbi:long-chain-fatty-acid--CoA ligase [Paraburkholderia sacchari]|uniref:long-chain-fatty-acid--CoA ligase n=1 Tax=Paraburkholderia sacchari TaxID=159450 RepID=UPI0005420D0E|nr:long-chain-fatty-acid--CoA ligase [Paraburkholderia sacchari]NLP62594.1 AMP-binding protein [Paraburkholderia sacchari]
MARLIRHYAHWPEGVPHTLRAPESNLFSFLAASAARCPEKTAIDYYGAQMSYRTLHEAVLNLAGYMQQRLSVRGGDRVLLLMQNCPHFAIAYYAVLRCGAVVVPANPMSTAAEVAYYAADSGARVAITTQDMLPRLTPLLESGALAGCVVGACSEFAGEPRDVPFMEIPAFVREPRQRLTQAGVHEFAGALAAGIAPTPLAGSADLAVIGYTSGTTGEPKGAMLSHRAFSYVVNQRVLWFSDDPDSSDLITLPVSHVAGMCALNQALVQGRTMVLLARWDAAAVPRLIEHHRIGCWAAVTPMLVELLGRPELAQHDLSSLCRLYGGATAMPEAVARQIEQRLGVPYIECYGMTETCGSTHMNPPQASRQQCAGIPQINVDARVIDPDGGAELGPNQPGELVMHSPTQFDGYWGRPDASEAAFVEIDGKRFVRSGDIGHYDEDGYFYITDRLKRMINASGLKVWPAEIESRLHGHPAVREACVISAHDAHRGETVKALVVLRDTARDTLTPEALMEWARSCMAAYKVPRQIEFVESLPRSAAGKLLWRIVQDNQNQLDSKANLASPAERG